VPTSSPLSDHALLAARPGHDLTVRRQPFPCESSPVLLDEWRDLEQRSLLRNPFLSSAFLFPQWQFVEEVPPAQLLTVVDQDGRWLLAGIFEHVRGTSRLPLPHLRAAETHHTFMTGCLIDSDHSEAVSDALWSYLRRHHLHGLSFPMFPVESPLGQLFRGQCEKSGTVATVDDVCQRATVTPQSGTAMSSKRAKSLRRGRRALEKLGQVSLKFNHCPLDDLSAVERFLFLESLGWKGESQSAIACRMSEVQAFKATARVLAQENRIHFAELHVDERVIASMCLFRSGSDYSAFKIGWDPQFERGCPGFLLAADLQENMHHLPGCRSIDSCACPGSFLDHVWPGRMSIGTALFTTTRWGSLAVRGTRLAREIYRQVRGHSNSTSELMEHDNVGTPDHDEERT
jgi:CelD/BcsL family acetyltransferase involved in cellulose biosynthesis